jgi:HlyD family secretion protein
MVAVQRQAIVESVVATGRLQAPARIEVGAELAGTVARVSVREGQEVGPGQELIALTDSEARSALAQAQAAVTEAAGKVEQQVDVSAPLAEQVLVQARAAWLAADRDYGRTSELVAQGFFSPQRLDEARRARDVASSAVVAAQLQAQAQTARGVEPALARARLAQAQASAAMARARLDRMRIRSPVAARVLLRQVEPGAMAQPGRVLLVLAQAGAGHIDVSIDERHLHLLSLGMPARALADAYPEQPFEAQVCEIAPAIDPDRGSLVVRLCLPQPPAFLKPDMTISAELIGSRREAALVLPSSAVRDVEKPAPWVLVWRAGRAEKVAVRLGLRGVGSTEILEGLSEGQWVIAPTQAVLPGERVRRGAERGPSAGWPMPSFLR